MAANSRAQRARELTQSPPSAGGSAANGVCSDKDGANLCADEEEHDDGEADDDGPGDKLLCRVDADCDPDEVCSNGKCADPNEGQNVCGGDAEEGDDGEAADDGPATGSSARSTPTVTPMRFAATASVADSHRSAVR